MHVKELPSMAKFLILASFVHLCAGQAGVFQFRAVELRVSESSRNAIVVLENSGNLAETATVRISTADGTAIAGEDYTAITDQRLEFLFGVSRKEVSIPILNDAKIEGEESFVVNVRLDGPSSPSQALGNRKTMTVIIMDNDPEEKKQEQGSNGGNITVDSEAKMQVVCESDYIEVSLQLSDYPGLVVNDSSLHLEDKACGAGYKDDTMVKFTFGLEACKTEQEDDGKKIYYRNKVYLKAGQPADDDAITRQHTKIIPFQCGYGKKITISKVSFTPRITRVTTDAEGFGNFTYFMDMYEDASNGEAVTEFPKEVGLGQKMYFGFRVESGDSKLIVFPDVCKATASSSFDSTPDHLIIENACSRDNTLEYQYGQKTQHFFNVAAFRFKEGYDDVYMHCKVTVCHANEDGTRCARGCQPSNRKRRSTEEDMSANLYVGPLKPKMMTDEAAKEHSYAESESSNSMVVIVAALVGVLGTVAIGLIAAVIIISRRRNSSGKGASLIVAEEM